ncbi:MAG TPA: flagellin [Terracidiphilus sp.]|nr:flagellin [Terracidiphilus sp.]
MSLGVLNNLNALYATNNLNNTNSSLSKTLQQLSSGSKINSGADDAAGLSLVNGLAANATALTQSSTNATEGVGLLQVADGALSQVTSLLNRAVTLATESSNGTLNSTQRAAADQEYQSILSEISNIGSTTTYNQQAVFGGSFTIYVGDSSVSGSSTNTLSISGLDATTTGKTVGEGDGTTAGGTVTYTGATGTTPASITYTANTGVTLAGTDLTTAATAQTALNTLNSAISAVAAQDGYIGAQINTLNSTSQVLSTQQQNIVSAQNAVQATDYATATSNLSKYEILSQTGISALAQANSLQQEVTKLLQ